MFCCRLGSHERVFVGVVCVCVCACVYTYRNMREEVCASLAGCGFVCALSFIRRFVRVCVRLCILSMKVHPSIMWAWRPIEAHVIPNQLLGSSLALHWSSSELIFQPSDILCVALGNNRSCSHQMCYVIDVTGSFAAHVMGALFHSHCRLPQYAHTVQAHTLQ